MARPPIPAAFLQEACDRYQSVGRNVAALARALAMPRTTCRYMLEAAAARGIAPRRGIAPTPPAAAEESVNVLALHREVETLRTALDQACKPHFTVRTDAARSSPRGAKIRLICIGDAHDSPAISDKSRFAAIGRYIRAVAPDVVVQIGDFATLDSLNSHAPADDSSADPGRPSFMEDMASFDAALAALNITGPERHCTLGNHESRLFRFELRSPAASGLMRGALQETFRRHKWTFSPYGHITMYGGVGFVHAALNRLGRPYGGKTAEHAVANDSLHDLVIGHSHTERRHRAPKIGGNNFIQVVNVGCALPDKHIEAYAEHALTGWSYGIADMTIQYGHIQDYRFVSMATLEDSYGRGFIGGGAKTRLRRGPAKT